MEGFIHCARVIGIKFLEKIMSTQSGKIPKLITISTLDLSINKFTSIPEGLPKSIVTLDMRKNIINRIHFEPFKIMTKLKFNNNKLNIFIQFPSYISTFLDSIRYGCTIIYCQTTNFVKLWKVIIKERTLSWNNFSCDDSILENRGPNRSTSIYESIQNETDDFTLEATS